MGPDRHKEGSILPEPPIAIAANNRAIIIHRPSCPLHITPPTQLDIDSCPSPPVGGVVSGCSRKPLVREFIAEVICYVPEMVRVKSERLRGLNAGECGGRSRKPVDEGAAQAPRKELVPEESTGLEQARRHHPSA